MIGSFRLRSLAGHKWRASTFVGSMPRCIGNATPARGKLNLSPKNWRSPKKGSRLKNSRTVKALCRAPFSDQAWVVLDRLARFGRADKTAICAGSLGFSFGCLLAGTRGAVADH